MSTGGTTKVEQILEKKSRVVHTIEADSTVFEALQIMAEQDIGALIVLEGELIVGVLTERDYARKVILAGLSSPRTEVRKIMGATVVYATLDETADECMAVMADKHIRYLPVLDHGGRLVGVISIGDLVKASIADKEFVIGQLEKYITGH